MPADTVLALTSFVLVFGGVGMIIPFIWKLKTKKIKYQTWKITPRVNYIQEYSKYKEENGFDANASKT